VHLFIFQGIGIFSGLLIPKLMNVRGNQVCAALTASADIASIAGFDGAAGGSDNDFAIVQDTQRPQRGDNQRRHTPEGE